MVFAASVTSVIAGQMPGSNWSPRCCVVWPRCGRGLVALSVPEGRAEKISERFCLEIVTARKRTTKSSTGSQLRLVTIYIVDALSPSLPRTRSRAILDEALRRGWMNADEFDGVIGCAILGFTPHFGARRTLTRSPVR